MIIITMARKPLCGGSVASNVLNYGTGVINIDKCRVEYVSDYDKKHQNDIQIGQLNADNGKFFGGKGKSISSGSLQGRWPANVILTNTPEICRAFPNTVSGEQAIGGHIRNSDKHRNAYAPFQGQRCEGDVLYGDFGSASRFFKQVEKE